MEIGELPITCDWPVPSGLNARTESPVTRSSHGPAAERSRWARTTVGTGVADACVDVSVGVGDLRMRGVDVGGPSVSHLEITVAMPGEIVDVAVPGWAGGCEGWGERSGFDGPKEVQAANTAKDASGTMSAIFEGGMCLLRVPTCGRLTASR